MKSKVYKKLTETKYLSAENAWRYRAIMRTFFMEDQKYRHWLSKEDLYELLIVDQHFSDYTIDMCRQDLDALTEWGNLSTKQDTSKVANYQDFINKQYQYQMTEYAIEIERMTLRLENLTFESGSLEASLLERIKHQIQEIPSLIESEAEVVVSWWSQLKSDFQRLNKNYQDYIRDWNSLKAEEMMQTQNFLIYKDKLVDYLRHFVQELQHHGIEISRDLKSYDGDEIDFMFDKVVDYEMSIPMIELRQVTSSDMKAYETDKFESIRRFFITGSEASELDNILEMTNEIIRRITRYALSLLEMTSQFSSRKDEYKRIAGMFSKCADIEAAHKLSSQVFGIKSYLHLNLDHTRTTESISSSIYDEAPMVMSLTPKIRTYRERLKKSAILDHQEDIEAMRIKTLEARRQEQELVDQYLSQNPLHFDSLGHLPEKVRRVLIKWLIKAINDRQGRGITEYGKRYRIINPKEQRTCRIESEDGILELPAFILSFEE